MIVSDAAKDRNEWTSWRGIALNPKCRSPSGTAEDRNYEQIQKNRREAICRSIFEAAEKRNSIIDACRRAAPTNDGCPSERPRIATTRPTCTTRRNSAWRSPLRAIKDRNDSEGEYEEDVMQMAWPFGAAEDRNLHSQASFTNGQSNGGRA